MVKTLQIAIDGPVAAGKGTAAKLVAKRLGWVYIDSGAIYRALTLYLIEHKINWNDEQSAVAAIKKERPVVTLESPTEETDDGRLVTVILNGEDVSWRVRTEQVSNATSPVAQYQEVRLYVNELAREMAKQQNVVMEGRDITGVVLPRADLKMYMDALPEVRARRRHKELQMRGQDVSLEFVLKDLRERDARDMEHNLKKVPGVFVLDTTELSIEEVVEIIVGKVKELG